MKQEQTWKPLFSSDFSFTTPFNIFKFVQDAVIRRNESVDFFLSGDRGMGKSACAMSLAKMLDPNFTVDHWAFTSDRFIDLITTHHPKGTVICFDDVGTEMGSSSRKWNNDASHNLSDIMQINRTDGIITIGTSLQLSRMELRLREGFRVLCQPIRKLTAQETGSGMAIDVEMRLRSVDVFDNGSVRYKLWRYCPGGRVKYVRLFHPPVDMWREYQGARKDFLEGIKAKRAEQAAAAAEKKEKKEENAAIAATKATDREWAKEVSIRATDFKIYKNLLKRVDKEWDGSSTETAITKSELTTAIMEASGNSEKTASRRIETMQLSGLFQKKRQFSPDGKPTKEYAYRLTDKAHDLIENRPIMED
jgi:hypothetical protein